MAKMSPTMLRMLERIRDGAQPEQRETQTVDALIRRGWIRTGRRGWLLTRAGRAALKGGLDGSR